MMQGERPETEIMEPQQLFVNRELSWLEFNRRVLLEATDEKVPLLERLKFLSIYASNLDEFFMVRVGSLTDQSRLDPERRDDKTGMTAAEQIAAIMKWIRNAQPEVEHIFISLRKQLKEQSIDLVDFSKLSQVEEVMARKYFKEEIKPLLSPQIVDRHHPFPFLNNKEVYIAASFAQKNGVIKLGIVPLSGLPPYFLFSVDNRQKLMFTSQIVLHFVQTLYSKYEIAEKLILRVTRNADISVDEGLYDYDIDFRGIMQDLLKKRKRLRIVRAELSREPSDALRKYLCQKLSVGTEQLLVSSTPMPLSLGFSLPGNLKTPRKDLLYKERKSSKPDFGRKTILGYLNDRDLLLAYPFQGMNTFIKFLHEAADDPNVLSIKISLYRMANHSRVVSALAYAAEKGKEVLCVLELRARFDEQNNIDYARVLEDAGCTVIYGLSDYKVHAKLCLVTRKLSNGKIGYITQVGTGNYNEKTAEQYTDLAYITTDEVIGQDASNAFSALCMGETVEATRSLWIAPNCYVSKLLDLIQNETQIAHSGGAGRISIKVNSINDMEVMQRLIEASQAGVKVELFVRGICCLRPGVAGLTENIRVRSIVGRLLEHSRIFVFGEGERQTVYIGSGDLLNRNTRRRVEAFICVRDEKSRADVLHIMDSFQNDNVKAWEMQPEGNYIKAECNQQQILDSQMHLYDYFQADLSAPVKEKHSMFKHLLNAIKLKK